MRIIGIGTDIVQISRISVLIERFGEKFVHRILSLDEQKIYSECQNQQAFLAKRFAAKEAVAKALGTGIGHFFAFTDISVLNAQNGKPYVKFLGKAAVFSNSLTLQEVMISLSDEKEYAVAFVMAMGG